MRAKTRAQLVARAEEREAAKQRFVAASRNAAVAESESRAAYSAWMAAPDYDITRCAEDVWSNWHTFQCSRPNGHGPEGLYCKQHAKKYGEAVGE